MYKIVYEEERYEVSLENVSLPDSFAVKWATGEN
jgi:hypothetical protein